MKKYIYRAKRDSKNILKIQNFYTEKEQQQQKKQQHILRKELFVFFSFLKTQIWMQRLQECVYFEKCMCVCVCICVVCWVCMSFVCCTMFSWFKVPFGNLNKV